MEEEKGKKGNTSQKWVSRAFRSLSGRASKELSLQSRALESRDTLQESGNRGHWVPGDTVPLGS